MSKQAVDTSSSTNSSTTGEGASTPASNHSTSSHNPQVPIASLRRLQSQQNMDDTNAKDPAPAADREENAQSADVKAEADTTDAAAAKLDSPGKKTKCKKPEHKKPKKDKKKAAESKKAGKSDSTSDNNTSDDDSSDSSSSSSEDEKAKKKSGKSKKSKKSKSKSSKKSKKVEADSDSSDSDSDDSSSEDSDADVKAKLKKLKKAKKSRSKKLAKAKKAAAESEEEESGEDDAEGAAQADLDTELQAIQAKIASLRLQQNGGKMAGLPKLSRAGRGRHPSFSGLSGLGRRGSLKTPKVKLAKAADLDDDDDESPHFKRVDQLWDSSIHNYKLKESAEEDESEFSEYAFLVRRTFDWENRYQETVVDIKSKQLRAALQDVMKGCKSVSLEAKEPCIDPNLLFLYLDELRAYYKTNLKSKIKAEKKRKTIKKLQEQREQVKALVGYIDDDYADTKKTLYPLLKAGNITFDLMWALFKPNDIAVSSCYGNWDEPRCFKIDYANLCQSMMRGKWWCIEGSYLEYDGKAFGFGDFEVDIDQFKGPRKISSLATYPLKYHREEEKVKKQIIERGERFVGMAGMHYKFHKGLAFMKKKKQVLKININGRIMIDPATFRRVNPNYQISWIKPKEDDDLFSLSDDEAGSDDEGCCSCAGSDDEDDGPRQDKGLEKKFDIERPKYKYKWDEDERGNTVFMAVEVDEDGDPLVRTRAVDKISGAEDKDATKSRVFTEEELLLTSPVMLGFAFSEKLWLEFTISGIHEISWNENAFDSLVLPPNQKSIVRALVESHKFSAHRAIDDVVQGKGKGLVSVLHGPPGTGKTLTAEGISEMLKCPLYMVSAGELGTDPARLEHELQKILDIAHSWGAILLLDEADVFLEKREVHDIHRNALVSIFLRLLEYFQGILFLTTNRVETFDDAFQSRIHVALRYGELTHKAKKTVWSMFIAMVRKEMDVAPDLENEHALDVLARHELNGRQIKNLVRSAQALALHEKCPMGVEHVKRVVDVADTFSRDLRGGTGYIDAMRSYT